MDRIKGYQIGKRKTNAGFSLVELIIVIAIMAILIAVLAPQYLKYVEKTKANKDADAFGKLVQIVEYTIIDENEDITSDAITVTWNTSGGLSATYSVTGADTAFEQEVQTSLNGSTSNVLPCTSHTFRNSSGGGVSVVFSHTSDGNWIKTSSGVFESYVDY